MAARVGSHRQRASGALAEQSEGIAAMVAREKADRRRGQGDQEVGKGRVPPAVRPVIFAGAVGAAVVGGSCPFVVWQAASLLGWVAAALAYLGWVWRSIAGLDAGATSRLATREDPSVAVTDLIIIGAGLACLGAVGLVLVKAAHSHGGTKALLIALGVLSVALAFACVHTVFTLRYAREYYGTGNGDGIDFHSDERPDYFDFAYVAFTIGLTFQVSDTDLVSRRIRRVALRHALVSFLFGAIIIGLTINVVASLLH